MLFMNGCKQLFLHVIHDTLSIHYIITAILIDVH